MSTSNIEDTSPFYRKSSANIPKYADVQGEEQPVECVKYKWPEGGEENAVPKVIMGQEDLYREEPLGTVVTNSNEARIVFGATTPFSKYEIVYLSGPTSWNTGLVVPSSQFVEHFLPGPLSDGLYKFSVKLYDSDDNLIIDSDPYYFRIGAVSTPSLSSPPVYKAFLFAEGTPTLCRLFRSDLDGSNPVLLKDLGNEIIHNIIGYDVTGDRIYYLAGGLRSLAADGSGSSTLHVGATTNNCTGDIDVVNRIIYFGDSNGRIRKFDIAASMSSVIFTLGSAVSVKVAFDYTRNYVYSLFSSSGNFRRMKPDGTDIDIIGSLGAVALDGLSIDPHNGHLFFTKGGFSPRSLERISLFDFTIDELVVDVYQNLGTSKVDLNNLKIYITDESATALQAGRVLTCDMDGGNLTVLRVAQSGGTPPLMFSSKPIEKEYV